MQDLLALWDAIFADGVGFELVDFVFVAMLLYIRDLCKHATYQWVFLINFYSLSGQKWSNRYMYIPVVFSLQYPRLIFFFLPAIKKLSYSPFFSVVQWLPTMPDLLDAVPPSARHWLPDREGPVPERTQSRCIKPICWHWFCECF